VETLDIFVSQDENIEHTTFWRDFAREEDHIVKVAHSGRPNEMHRRSILPVLLQSDKEWFNRPELQPYSRMFDELKTFDHLDTDDIMTYHSKYHAGQVHT